eukprot:3636848-Heterocapsa_arctica.AAC.1
MLTANKTDTEWVECNAGIGTWCICRSPDCQICNMIEEAHMETLSLPGIGATVEYIGMLKRETNWSRIGMKQRIGHIG